MEIWAFAIMGIVNIACFMVGAKVGQTVQQGKEIEVKLPAVSPIEGYRALREKKEAQKEQERLDVIMHNIECYDGTPAGQKEVK